MENEEFGREEKKGREGGQWTISAKANHRELLPDERGHLFSAAQFQRRVTTRKEKKMRLSGTCFYF